MYFRNKISQTETSKYWLNLVDFSVVLILEKDSFPAFLSTSFWITREKLTRFQKGEPLICDISVFAQMTKYLMPQLCSGPALMSGDVNEMSMKQVMSEAGLSSCYLKMVKLLGRHLSWSQRSFSNLCLSTVNFQKWEWNILETAVIIKSISWCLLLIWSGEVNLK